MLRKTCWKNARCHNHRRCEMCAEIRAFYFSVRALRNIPNKATLTICGLMPTNPDNTAAIRTAISKWARKRFIGHCWAIEKTETANRFFISFIIASRKPIAHNAILEATPGVIHAFQEEITRKEFKDHARYINDYERIPDELEYKGRTSGRSGCMIRSLHLAV